MIASLMLYAMLVAALVCLIALLLERAVGIAGGPRRIVWALALVVSLALPAFRIWSPQATAPAAAPVVSSIRTPAPVRPATDRAHATLPAAPLSSPPLREANVRWPALPDLNQVFVTLWWASSASVLLTGAFLWLRLQRAARGWPRRRVDGESVLVSANLGPAVLGFLRPQIVLPGWLLERAPEARRLVIAHEREHIAARDSLLLLLALLIVACAAWNVLLWWQLRRLRFAIEVDCDARVLRQGTDARHYGETLLTIGQHRSRTSFAAVSLTEPTSQLERRIRIMVQHAPRCARLAILALSVTAASLLAAAAEIDAPAAATQSAPRLPPPWANPMPPGMQKITALVNERFPELREEPLQSSFLVNVILNADGTVRHLEKEVASPDFTAASPKDSDIKTRLRRFGLADTPAPAMVSMLRVGTEAGHPVDLFVAIAPVDVAALEKRILAALDARHVTPQPNVTNVVTVVLNKDGSIRQTRQSVAKSPEDARADLPKLQHFVELGMAENDVGFTGLIQPPIEAAYKVFIEYALPKTERETFFSTPADHARVQRALVQEHFPDLLGDGVHAHALSWVLLGGEGEVLGTGRSPLGPDDLSKQLQALNPGTRIAPYRVVRRLTSLFDTPGLDANGEPLMVAFLWKDMVPAPLASPAAPAAPQPPRLSVDANVYRNGTLQTNVPLTMSFGETASGDVPGRLRFDVIGTNLDARRVILDMTVHVNVGTSEATFADHWRNFARIRTIADYDTPWSLGPTIDNPQTEIDEGGWTIELTPRPAPALAAAR